MIKVDLSKPVEIKEEAYESVFMRDDNIASTLLEKNLKPSGNRVNQALPKEDALITVTYYVPEKSLLEPGEEGLKKFLEERKERIKQIKDAKYIEEFDEQKKSLIKTTSKKIGQLEGWIERLEKMAKEDDEKCFKAICKMYSSLITVLEHQIEKLKTIEYKDRDSIDTLNETVAKYNKDKRYDETMAIIKKEFPKAYSRAIHICNLKENAYKNELKKQNRLSKLIEDDDDEAAEEAFIDAYLEDLIAEEGILSFLQRTFHVNKEAKSRKEFTKMKEKLCGELSQNIKDIDRFTRRVDKAKTEYNKACFNALISTMWKLRGIYADELKAVKEVTVDGMDEPGRTDKPAIDAAVAKLKSIKKEAEDKALDFNSKIERITGKYPDTSVLANKIANFENYWKDEKEFNEDIAKLKEGDKEVAEESVIKMVYERLTEDYHDIYYAMLSRNYDKASKITSHFLSGKKTYVIPRIVAQHIIEIKNQYFPTIGTAVNDALDTYDKVKPIITQEKSFIFRAPEPERDTKIVESFAGKVQYLHDRLKSYNLDTMNDFITSKTTIYETHRYDPDVIKVDSFYLKNLLKPDETFRVLRKLEEIRKSLPDLDKFNVIAKHSKEIAKYVHLSMFDGENIKAPIHAYYNYVTELTMFMDYIYRTLLSYLAAIFEILNFTTIEK